MGVSRTVTPMRDGSFLITLDEIEEERLRVEERYRLISENCVDVIWVWNLQKNRCIYVTPSVLRVRGFSPEEVMRQSMEEALTPESFRVAEAGLQACISSVEAGNEADRIRSFELDFNCKDGSTVATETLIKLISDGSRKVELVVGVTRDVSERRMTQRALRDVEEEYRKIFDGALEGIYRTSPEGILTTGNRAMAKMLGYESAEELLHLVTDIGQQLWIDAGERARFISLLQERDTVRDFECRLRRKDGRVIWASFSSRRVLDADGLTLYHEGFMEDITERKRMEDALRQSEEKFSRAFLASPACVVIQDIHDNGRIVDVNEAFEQVTGYRRRDAIGQTGRDLDLWTDQQEAWKINALLRAEGRIRDVEGQFRARNGEVRTGLFSAELIELDGKQCAITTIIDITQRKRAEERIESLATAIEQAGEQIVITDLKANIQYCNPAFEKTTGYSKEEVLGKNPNVLKSGKQSEDFYRTLWATIRSGSVWTGQFLNRRKNGDVFEEEATISPIRDVAGNIKGYVAIKRDVSERIQLENRFRQAQKLESIGRLAGGVAHDFNNLLTIINGYGDLLLEQLKTYDPLRPHAEEIRKAGQRAAGLTRQLLAFSRKQVIEVKAIDLNGIVKDAERMLERVIGEDIELLTRLDPSLESVMGDPDQLHQIIMNLVVNSRDAMPDGGKLIIETRDVELRENVSLAHPDAVPGHYALLSVTDTGTGMDEKTLESIFEPFFTTKEQGKGTGLGLSTVYGIARQSGGWVEVSSQVGAGTTFKVYLPRVERSSTAPAPEAPSATQAVIAGKTVLLVEDQDEVRRLIKAILKKQGYNVIDAGNGADAYVLAQQYVGEIHLLLTDVVMPGMNGKDLSERLRIVRPSVRVLFSSGYTADVIARRGVLDPQVAYLPKPFTGDALTTKVREMLRD